MSMTSSNTEQEQLYALGYHLYERGDYAQADQCFSHLVWANPFTQKYWRGLASSKQMQREYSAALHAWSLVAFLEEKDPFAHFHAAECFLCLHEREEALKAFAASERLLTESEEHKALRDKIEILKNVGHYDSE